ncbi:MAG: hypothetical protein U5K79_04615 [Cyclobacteriaceae bacterium]|nr:hypothetical protein [Cyclobacteriaceae bacterium]
MNITEGSVGDNKGAYDIPLEKGSVIVADRYYNDFPMLNVWDSKGVFLSSDTKQSGFYLHQGAGTARQYRPTCAHRRRNRTDPSTVKGQVSGRLRRVAVWDEENQQTIEPITNNSTGLPKPSGISTNQDGRSRCFSGISNSYCTSKPSSALPKMRS